MIAYVKGKLISHQLNRAVVEVNGIGYDLLIPFSSVLPTLGKEVLLHTSLVVREDSHTLYGFLTFEEKDLFLLLLNVTGIGPKMALNIIGHLSLERLTEIISQAEVTLLSKIPGIGKKTAERLIVELKDKLSASPTQFQVKLTPTLADAQSALINLGYSSTQAEKAVKKTIASHGEALKLPELITLSLKHI